MDETVPVVLKQPEKLPLKLLIVLMVLSPPLLLIFGCGFCYLAYRFDLWANPLPAGYSNWLLPRNWDTDSIRDFLGVSIPPDALNLNIEGNMGSLGEYGIDPSLSFAFQASPDSALEFAQGVCSTLYVGYNPLVAVESYTPAPDVVLIRAGGSIHYSHSPNVPDTIMGNRCQRRGWLAEIVLDTADPSLSRVTYHLPSNRYAPEYYTMAKHVDPLGLTFRLYVTGLHERSGKYVLTFPMMCLETASQSQIADYWIFQRNNPMGVFEGADVSISVDDVAQVPAIIENGALKQVRAPDQQNESLERWDYCLSDNWQAGTHTIEMRVTPPQGDTEIFEWSFDVLESQAN
jgi:hypothetical protein